LTYVFHFISKEEKYSSTSSSDETNKNETSAEKVEYDDFFDNEGWLKKSIFFGLLSVSLRYAFAFIL
jgi:hypothetical protein